MKTIKEAIQYHTERAKALRARTHTDNFIGERRPLSKSELDEYREQAEEHEQLAEWLKELKDLRIFAAFAAKSVCSDEFEEDSDFYAEVLCRKLTKLGYIELDGDTYKLKENSTCTEQP